MGKFTQPVRRPTVDAASSRSIMGHATVNAVTIGIRICDIKGILMFNTLSRSLRRLAVLSAFVGLVSLTGCGDPYDPGARAGSGALIGAGGGAAIGALAGGGRGAAIGALAGGAAGAAGGAATTPNRPRGY
ncbi:hypothetical protein [Brytella acorum]|uniref:YMGG-like Gly-zipper domain-containing protein n=2 Tax=Brytella acorum TaxID=2959299 RepID=A0AA35UF60_9PROT|nr:hypothetical protein [Brytella acorum]CAI9119971.1 hypothetical protein LMG32879_000797 [Brytella acorum]